MSEIKSSEKSEGLALSALLDNLLKGLKKYYWLMLVVISVTASISYFRAQKAYIPQYEASASFIVNTNQAYGYNETYYDNATAKQMSKTFPYILTSGVLRDVVSEDLGVDYINGSIRAEAMEETNLFTISVVSKDPENSYAVLQSVIKNYPQVAQYIIGDTQLKLMDETGVPKEPVNRADFMGDVYKGLITGAMIAAVILLLYALTRNTIKSGDDLKQMINVKFLGNVDMVKAKKRRTKKEFVFLTSNIRMPHYFVESLRMVRTRLEQSIHETDAKKILFTSALPNEGKTTICANLALGFALKDKNTILIDCDLRNPSVKDMFPNEIQKDKYTKDLRLVLEDEKGSAKACLTSSGQANLDLLYFIGEIGKPSKILGSSYFEKLLVTLAKEYDYIFIDTPPCTILSDAAIVGKNSDGAVLIAKQDYATKPKILNAVGILEDTGLPILGVVLNEVEVGIGRYNYGYGYKYGSKKGSSYGEK